MPIESPVIHRHPNNPILRATGELPWASAFVLNPGVVFDNRLFRMLFTAGNGDGALHLGYAESRDGIHFTPRPHPLLSPSANPDAFDFGTVDDPRITILDNQRYIVYAARSQNMNRYASGDFRVGPHGERWQTWRNNYRRIGLATISPDWTDCRRIGSLSSPHLCDANALLFPEKVNGEYVYLHRPTAAIPWTLPMRYCPGAIWILFTKQVSHWASDRREDPWNMVDKVDMPDDYLLLRPERSWESDKVGALGVPIVTDDGFLAFYHGVDRAGTYRVGLVLLDRADPRKVLCRTPFPIMEPETPLEKSGSYPNCIFPCANVLVGDEIRLYYGAGDQCICMAMASLRELMNHVKRFPVK
ncbi:MAG: hypothetical protein IJJ33_02195 [Victivallales bacterium]|nr:hypothetical protein [Victivallales bacterium]